jgi:phosphate transport system substrate-binding protein
MGGIVPVVNLEGIRPGDLVLDRATLAKIFLGQVKTWDDPGISGRTLSRLAEGKKIRSAILAKIRRALKSGGNS